MIHFEYNGKKCRAYRDIVDGEAAWHVAWFEPLTSRWEHSACLVFEEAALIDFLVARIAELEKEAK